MSDEKQIVEVKVITEQGEEVPVGIMNTSQALKLPEEMDVSVSHPDEEAGATDKFIKREELRSITTRSAAGFPSPASEDVAARADQAQEAVRSILDEVVSSANEAGWSTQEIVSAIMLSAGALSDATSADPDPAADPNIADAAREQIGHGEQYD